MATGGAKDIACVKSDLRGIDRSVKPDKSSLKGGGSKGGSVMKESKGGS